jgi:uncharacterized repeat protein (TIGR01451 family)
MAVAAVAITGCKTHMPHAATWPAGGDIVQSHAKPPEGGYYSNWDPWAAELEVTPVEDVNPVRTQHYLIATVRDKDGKPLPNRRVEWIISTGSVGDIIEVDESGWRASRGYKVDNHYAVSHTNNFDHTLTMGTDDTSDDIELMAGQTWCVITSPIEGDTHITAYAPGIHDTNKHKVFVTKHWYDVAWEFPEPAVNPIGTSHEFVTMVMKHSDGSPLAGYIVNYEIVDGPGAVFERSGQTTESVQTDDNGMARVTIKQTSPAEGTNNVKIDIMRPADIQCCKPAAHIADGMTSKTWIGPDIACNKSGPASALVGQEITYTIDVTNPSQVDATNVMVTDNLPSGLEFVSANPQSQGSGNSLSWSLGTIAPGATQSISVTARAAKTGTYENCAEVHGDYNVSSRCCTTTVVTAPAISLEKNCPAEALQCDTFEYTIIVRNTGDGAATGVRITDDLPDGITTVNGKSSVSADVGTLQAGEAKQVRFSVQASRTGSFTNTARATGDNGLTAEASCTTVVKMPKLEVSKTGPEVRYIGRNAVFEVTVTNTGDADARDTMLVDTLPAGTEYVSASDGGQYNNGNVSWSLGTLAPGASRTVNVTVRAREMGTVRNVAKATAVCAEDSAEVSMQIKGIPAILLEVVDLEDPIEVGTNVTYNITVTNQGSATGTNIVIEATIPPEGDYVNAQGPTAGTVSGKTVKFAPLPTLAPKAKAVYTVTVKAVSENDVRFKIRLDSDQISSPVEETESTNFYK